MLTFYPTRTKADVLAGAEIRATLRSLRDQYYDDVMEAFKLLAELNR